MKGYSFKHIHHKLTVNNPHQSKNNSSTHLIYVKKIKCQKHTFYLKVFLMVNHK